MSTAIAALPFYGGTLACFDPSDNTVIEATTAGTYSSTFSTCSLSFGTNDVSFATSPTWTAAATFWAHFVLYQVWPGQTTSEFDNLYLLNGSTVVAKVTCQIPSGPIQATYRLYTLQSAVMTLVGSVTIPVGALQTFDVNVVGNTASGSATLYVAGTKAISGTSLNHSGFTGVTQIKLLAVDIDPSYWSQVKCDSASTVGSTLYTVRINTSSAVNTGWTGLVGNINEIPTSDAQFISVTTSNQISTYYQASLALSGYVITGVGVGARMRVQSTNPPKIKLVIRSGSTNFPSTAIVAGTGFQAAFNSWTTDPHTSLAWTLSGVNAAQEGVESSS